MVPATTKQATSTWHLSDLIELLSVQNPDIFDYVPAAMCIEELHATARAELAIVADKTYSSDP